MMRELERTLPNPTVFWGNQREIPNHKKMSLPSNASGDVTGDGKGEKRQTRWPINTLLHDSELWDSQRNKLRPDTSSAVLRATPSSVPTNFDGITVWRNYFPPIKNQCNCGGCWAFATTMCLAARINIWTDNKVHVNLSPADLIYCNWGGETEYDIVADAFDKQLDFKSLSKDIRDAVLTVGCSGETLIGAWQFLYRYGTSTEECQPYTGPKGDLCGVQIGQTLPSCEVVAGESYDLCQDGTPQRQYRAGGFYIVGIDRPDKEAAIREEIYKFGPVTTGMRVYDDLFEWDGTGVYKWNEKALLAGGHAVVLVGWGVMNGTPYWQVRNSWGPDWGDHGYFRILRGDNHCEIESNVVTGYPDMLLANKFLLNQRLTTPQDVFLRNVWPTDPSGFNEERIHDILRGQSKSVLIQPLFPPSVIPDFKTMIAARPHEIQFPFARHSISWGYLLLTISLLGLLLIFLAWWILRKPALSMDYYTS